jgi:cytochrome c556
MHVVRIIIGAALLSFGAAGCVPKPKQDYTLEQLRQMENLEEIMHVQAATMDPQWKKMSGELSAADFGVLAEAGARIEATAEAIRTKHSEKRQPGFLTLAEQLGKQAKDLVAATTAKDAEHTRTALRAMKETCATCHKEYR